VVSFLGEAFIEWIAKPLIEQEAVGLVLPIAGVVDADPRGAADVAASHRMAAILDPQPACRRDRKGVEPLIDSQSLREPAWAAVNSRAANQHAGRRSIAIGDDVHHPVHAIGEMNVPVARRTEQDGGSRRNAEAAMTRSVVSADVGLGFMDLKRLLIGSPVATKHDEFSKQLPGNGERVLSEKPDRQDHAFGRNVSLQRNSPRWSAFFLAQAFYAWGRGPITRSSSAPFTGLWAGFSHPRHQSLYDSSRDVNEVPPRRRGSSRAPG
jgi:hypothetical protein